MEGCAQVVRTQLGAFKEDSIMNDRCERLNDLATELARYFTSGNSVPVTRITIDSRSDLYLLLREVMPDWQFIVPQGGLEDEGTKP
jgi:hypothetical protein